MSPRVARRRLKLLRGFGEAAVVAGQFFDVAQRGAESDFSGGAAFVELVEGAHGGGVELFRVGEDALFGFEGFVFAGLETGGFDLLALVGSRDRPCAGGPARPAEVR